MAVDEQDFSPWLPPADRTAGDFAVQTAKLRRTVFRAAGLALAWAAVFAAGVTGVTLAGAAAEDLLTSGVRVAGEVVFYNDPVKKAPYFQVRFATPDQVRLERIDCAADCTYHVGDRVTVFYDPADPARVRTQEEANPSGASDLSMIPTLAGLVGLPISVVVAAGWLRRLRAVAATGWRSAGVTVLPELGGGRSEHQPPVYAAYRDGSSVQLRRSLSTHSLRGLAGWENRRAWVGGRGRHMVVLIQRDQGLYAVPVRGVTTRRRVS
ncbi:DUF3592 domain-containing protein [Amycolatopsis sp. NPDC051758]|uniref:DUF3592 domain-containing protein n=1 Tax=Amycolatopsis sp. NPDC051758 TaxID=3363935 RepID=UPI0037A935AC